MDLTRSTDMYHVAMEVKGTAKGDQHSSGRGVLEEALAQVMKGVHGLAETFAARPALIPERSGFPLIPVVFTTASLFVSDLALGDSSLEDGRVPTPVAPLKRAPWLMYQWPVSPDLMHTVPGDRVDNRLSRVLEVDLVRTVAIVSPDGIAPYLQWLGETLQWR
jgi:hypothetical protein